ncbi:MAG: translation initiation factor IF-3 [Deltaproteobacteria bacterium]|nr:translation initiation factor IF-3 [Deltaproteobacteria bacterium]
MNHRIRVPEVRVIGADGSQLGVLQTHEAQRLAEEAGLDLVEVSPKSVPPVCKIMDYGRFKYEKSKKDKAARRHQSTVVLKEVKFRPKTDEHDLAFKVRNIKRFLEEGNKAKLLIIFRGREIVHPETGHAVLNRVLKEVGDLAAVEQAPGMDGRRMTMIIGPKVGVVSRPAAPPAAKPAAPPAPATASKTTTPSAPAAAESAGTPEGSAKPEP